jgi:2-(1,2-epoxy-1,2-dihydrophenyl)acetyl-CoA isomerase
MSAEIIQRIEDGIAIVVLSRPECRNAFNQALREQLAQCLETLTIDTAVRGIVITGAGEHFSVGGDVEAFINAPVSDLHALLAAAHRSIRAIRHAAKPVVAAVEGYAVGGATGLILACDAVVVAQGAKIGFPFLRLGLVPDWGSLYLLRAKIGEGAARRLLLRPSMVSSEEATSLGIADSRVGDGAALKAAIDMVNEFTALPSGAWQRTKEMLHRSGSSLEEALADEVRLQEKCFQSDDFREALSRFAANSKRN